ncbi:MAG: M14 family zinc carboxypeptidase [Phycisphaerae bacterium]
MRPTPPRAAVHSQVIGQSVRGRPIYMHIFGTTPNPALVFGGIHGNERNSSEMADLLIEHLQRNPHLTQGKSVAVIPHANPDGLVANTRHNVRGVDLNRNFPATNWKSTRDQHGETPLSESESRALYNAVRSLRPRLTISLHSINGQKQCNNYDGPAEGLARLMARFNGYPVKSSIGYPTPGSFGSWCGKDLNIPTITLEIPKSMPGTTGWNQNRDAILAAIGM